MIVNQKIKTLVAASIIFALIFPSVILLLPQKVQAQAAVAEVGPHGWWQKLKSTLIAISSGTSATTDVKNWAMTVLEEMAKAFAMKALQEITKSTVNWVNSGYAGKPLFLENPESFFKDIAKYEVRSLIDMFGYDQLRYPFGRDFALNTISAYRSNVGSSNAYTLSNYISDPAVIKGYQTDFNVGGWSAFLINTQYPQNNYLGFQMEATEELARRVATTGNNKITQVQNLLQQGQGFLSPQICATNPKYNNLSNEFNAPTFNEAKWEQDYVKANPIPIPGDTRYGSPGVDYTAEWRQKHDAALAEARANWYSKDNPDYCPPAPNGTPGLVNTTPGSVVANKIMSSVEVQGDLKKLAVNSGTQILSAVFDQLLNKFFEKGLGALRGSGNSKPPEDNWSYNGLTLGGPSSVSGYGEDIWSTPDEEVVLSEFKNTVDDAVADAKTEIQLIVDTINELNLTWPEARTLDICVPGPDFQWQRRLEEEANKYYTQLQDDTMRELQYAVNFFKDWINNNMLSALPNAQTYLDSVQEVSDLPQQAAQLTAKRRTRAGALTQLESIQATLAGITSQPAAGSAQEAQMVQLKQQFNGLRPSMTNSFTLAEAQTELATARGKKDNYKKMTRECEQAREAKGWGVPGGKTSTLAGAPDFGIDTIDGLEPNTEQALFCNIPIVAGTTHKMFTGPGLINIPMVNAANVLAGVDVKLDCSTIYEANILDYKGDLSGVTDVTEVP